MPIVHFVSDFIFLVIGTGIFVGTAFEGGEEGAAGIGAAMVVLGLLIRERRAVRAQVPDSGRDSTVDEPKSDDALNTSTGRNLKSKTMLSVALVFIAAFTLWASNKIRIDQHGHFTKFYNLDLKIERIEKTLSSMEGRLEEVEENSHYHRRF